MLLIVKPILLELAPTSSSLATLNADKTQSFSPSKFQLNFEINQWHLDPNLVRFVNGTTIVAFSRIPLA